jgi:hypothetical protein
MISIVCVYNDLSIYNEYLLPSIQRQEGDHELIAMDNRSGQFSSAAQALNIGGRKAKGSLIMFVHQDVTFSSNSFLADAEKMLRTLQDVGIVGVAGKRDNKGVITNITHGVSPTLAGSIQLDQPVVVQTVDECLVIIPKEIFTRIRFDEVTCNGWHLYAVDYCLSIGELALKVYVVPLAAHHESAAYSMSDDYYMIMKSVLKKHRHNYSSIFTTMGDWSTSMPFILQKIYKRISNGI